MLKLNLRTKLINQFFIGSNPIDIVNGLRNEIGVVISVENVDMDHQKVSIKTKELEIDECQILKHISISDIPELIHQLISEAGYDEYRTSNDIISYDNDISEFQFFFDSFSLYVVDDKNGRTFYIDYDYYVLPF